MSSRGGVEAGEKLRAAARPCRPSAPLSISGEDEAAVGLPASISEKNWAQMLSVKVRGMPLQYNENSSPCGGDEGIRHIT